VGEEKETMLENYGKLCFFSFSVLNLILANIELEFFRIISVIDAALKS
jgi:hypothetical protein